MTNQQIAKQLKNKGFNADVYSVGVIVSLNRKINTVEVETALDFNVPSESICNIGGKVIVFGFDS